MEEEQGAKSSVHVLSNSHVITVTLIMATLYIYMLTVIKDFYVWFRYEPSEKNAKNVSDPGSVVPWLSMSSKESTVSFPLQDN